MQSSQKRIETIANFKRAASIVFSPEGAFAALSFTITGIGVYALFDEKIIVGLISTGMGGLAVTTVIMNDQRMRRAAGAGLSRTATLVRKVANRLSRSGPVLLAALTIGYNAVVA